MMICARFCFVAFGGQTAQAVIATELDHQHADVAVQCVLDTAHAAGRRVAGHTLVHDLDVVTLRVQSLLQERGTDSSFVAPDHSPR
jgi:hypothetical protein